MQKTIRGQFKGQTGDSFFSLYLRDIAKIPLLSMEEERELGRRVQSGDHNALQKLIESNLRFVIRVARRFARKPDQLMELVNVGNVGLIEAARRFDPAHNVRFTSYAVWWIKQAIFHHLADMTYAFSVSPRMANVLFRAARVLQDPQGSLDDFSDRGKLAKQIGVDLRELNLALDTVTGTVSLDQPLREETDLVFGDTLPQSVMASPEQNAVMEHLRRSLEDLIDRLNRREQQVIRLRYGLNGDTPLTLERVGRKLDLSRERIRQIEKEALKKIRRFQSNQCIDSYLN
jgi:RNA polymerase primary sigma factor